MKSKLRFSLASFILTFFMTVSLQPLLANDRVVDKLGLIDLPPGFEIGVYAEGVENAHQLALDRILRYDGIESRLDQLPAPVVVSDAFPDKTHHGWKYLRFGPDVLQMPDGSLLVSDDQANAIYRISYAGGVE